MLFFIHFSNMFFIIVKRFLVFSHYFVFFFTILGLRDLMTSLAWRQSYVESFCCSHFPLKIAYLINLLNAKIFFKELYSEHKNQLLYSSYSLSRLFYNYLLSIGASKSKKKTYIFKIIYSCTILLSIKKLRKTTLLFLLFPITSQEKFIR